MDNPCLYEELHETFANIGYLVCQFANFEGLLVPALAMMINDNGDQASAVLGQVDSFSYRWGTLVGVAETLEGKNSVADVILKVQEDVISFNGFRNKLAHSGNRIENFEFWLITNATSLRRAGKKGPQGERINSALVQSHLDTIRRVMSEIEDVIDWTKMTGTKGLMRALHYTIGASNPDPKRS